MQKSLKRGAYDNELSRFRYDVVIEVGEHVELVPPEMWVECDRGGAWQRHLEDLLRSQPPTTVGGSMWSTISVVT